MRVVGRPLLDEYAQAHAEVRAQISAWLSEAEAAQWQTPDAIRQRHNTASILSEGRVVFNLKGNKYRLLVRVGYRQSIVNVLRIGTHAEYSKWDL